MFTKDDELKYKAFKSVIEKAKFDIEGRAILPVAQLLKWFYELEGKIKATNGMKPKREKKRTSINANKSES